VSRVLLVSHDRVGRLMAGPAIRAVELARALAQEHTVTLAAPNEPDAELGVPAVCCHGRELVSLAAEHEAIVVGGLTLALVPELASLRKPLVVDIYDPFTLENLQLFARQPQAARIEDSEGLLNALLFMLRHGDFFLCASDKQRDFWLGMLHAVGRLNPYTYDDDPAMQRLIAVVPFGIPAERPQMTARGLRGRFPGIAEGDFVVLWGGGLYDWFDPLTAIRAVAIAARSVPEIRLFFMGTKHPNPAVHEMSMVARARGLARELGLEGKHVFFHDWVPYQERANYLLDADVGLSLHQHHIETAFSFRTRVLDYIWAGLPIVTTVGDSLSELISREQLGLAVPPGDAEAVAQALVSLRGPEVRTEIREKAAAVAQALSWGRCAAPLVHFCREPRLASDRAAGYAFAPPADWAPQRLSTAKGLVAKSWASLQRGGLRQLIRDALSYWRWCRGR
jgi:glycosyltransferase involved in cell wall biosynthesis